MEVFESVGAAAEELRHSDERITQAPVAVEFQISARTAIVSVKILRAPASPKAQADAAALEAAKAFRAELVEKASSASQSRNQGTPTSPAKSQVEEEETKMVGLHPFERQ